MGFTERKPIQEIGKVYERWTITDIVSRLDAAGKPRYKAVAQCLCGVEKEVDLGSIRCGATRSCGCLQRETRSGTRSVQFPPYEEISSGTWRHWVYNASKKGLSFLIKPNEVWDLYLLQDRRCAISGILIGFGISTDQKQTTASLDRLDNTNGYVLDNIQLVHKRINFMRHTMSVDEFVSWCHLVADNQPNKSKELEWNFRDTSNG